MVFHGANVEGLTFTATDRLAHARVEPMGGGNQMAPWGVFHTSFHGLRVFLWALFKSSVATPKLEPSVLRALNTRFHVDGTAYHGVLVLAFYTDTPAPPSLTAETLDQAHIRPWGERCYETYYRPTPGTADDRNRDWTQMKHLHDKESALWPDILHAPEYPDMRSALARFNGPHNEGLLPPSGPLWRSAHCTHAATDKLQEKFHRAFAIAIDEDSLETKIPATPKTPAF